MDVPHGLNFVFTYNRAYREYKQVFTMPNGIETRIKEIKQKIKEKGSRQVRTDGNPHDNDIDRALSREGKKRKPDDIPKQDTTKRGEKVAGNVSSFQSSTVETLGQYKIGSASRPAIKHDSGFSKFPKKDPTLSDYWELLKWTTMLNGAATLRPDLVDATAAYSHFLNGEGKQKTFSYERYVMNDESGRITLRNAILDAQNAAIQLWKSNKKLSKFYFTGPAIPCGSSNLMHTHLPRAFPYPATENWQKAIGAHTIWLSGFVSVKHNTLSPSPPEFSMKMSLHAEDQYNFNPGQSDIASGIPDDANGKFVVCGLAHGYRHVATLNRSFTWKGMDLGVASMGVKLQMRQRSPNRTR